MSAAPKIGDIKDAALRLGLEYGSLVLVGVLAGFGVRNVTEIKPRQYTKFVKALKLAGDIASKRKTWAAAP